MSRFSVWWTEAKASARHSSTCWGISRSSKGANSISSEIFARTFPRIVTPTCVRLGDQRLEFLDEASVSVILTEFPEGLDLEGTLVVPTAQLLAVARAEETTWDNSGGERPLAASRVDSARIKKKQNQMLTVLSDASMALDSNRPVNELLEFILELAFELLKAERGVLMIDHDGELVARAVRIEESHQQIRFARAIADKVITEKVSILTSKGFHRLVLDGCFSMGIRSVMCVPLWNDGAVLGLIYVDSRHPENSFSEDDITLLTCFANLAAIKIENARLLKEMDGEERKGLAPE